MAMSRVSSAIPNLSAPRSWFIPFRLLFAASVCSLIALILAFAVPEKFFPETFIPIRLIFLAGSLILALAAVTDRLRRADEMLEERCVTAGYLVLAALIAFVGYLSSNEAWDSFRLLLGVLTGAGLVGAALAVVPQIVRRITLAGLILFHFVGILNCVFMPNVPAGGRPWVPWMLYTYIYRPHLQFAYLTSPYHYFSPDPSASQQLWIRVEYEPLTNADGTETPLAPRWVELPKYDQFATHLEYTRYIALSTNDPSGARPNALQIQQRDLVKNEYPWQNDTSIEAQYLEPSPYGKLLIRSYAMHVFRAPHSELYLDFRSLEHPEQPIKYVRIYRAWHQILGPAYFANEDWHPQMRTLFRPTFLGEFKSDGTMTESGAGDPCLYWIVPVMVVPKDMKQGQFNSPLNKKETVVKDFTRAHSGDDPVLPEP
jgi:hypothetical protein